MFDRFYVMHINDFIVKAVSARKKTNQQLPINWTIKLTG